MIVLGLGNPGRNYARTRHNVGFQCVDKLAQQHRINLNDKRLHAVLGTGAIQNSDVVLAKPRTYMNRSGTAARYLLDRYHISPQELLVVYDDMDLPLGKLRVRAHGSSGGHNGIKSIIAEVGTQEFPRLRIGIGRPQGDNAISHVLDTFTAEERKAMEEVTSLAVEVVAWIIQYGVDSAMNKYNA